MPAPEMVPRPPALEPVPAPEPEPAVVEPPLPTAGERARAVETLRRARELARAGQAGPALAAYDEAVGLVPAFADWAHALAAEAAAAAGDTAEVRRRVERIGEGPASAAGQRVRVAALAAAGDSAAALRVAEEAAAQLPTGSVGAEAWKRVGDLRRRAANPARARDAYRRAMEMAPASTGGLEAAREALELSALSPEDRLLIGRTLLRHGGTERGIAGLEAYLASGRVSEAERAGIHAEAGRTLFRLRRYAAAEPHLRAAAGHSPEAALLLARALYRRGRTSEAGDAFLEVARRFPAHDAAVEAVFILGDLRQGEGRVAEARDLYRRALATGVRSSAAGEAAARLAGIALLRDDARAVLADLEPYLAAAPDHRHDAPVLYWAGRAHEAAGSPEQARRYWERARRADPVSYYGARAAERLGLDAGDLPLAAEPRIDPAAEARAERAFFRMDLLREVDLREPAALELAWLRDAFADDPAALYLVAEGMIPRGQPIAAALLGQEIQRRRGAWDPRLLRIAYQFPNRDLIEAEARRHGLDPFMVAGLIRQESFFNPVAVSPAGAVGMMQVMPATGRGLARRVGLRGFSTDDLKRPEVNVRLGTLFLADQVRRYRTLTEVFAAYNAGPGRVARWRAFPEYRDEDLFVERIPFEETRDYVKKVRLNRMLYRHLYGDGAATDR